MTIDSQKSRKKFIGVVADLLVQKKDYSIITVEKIAQMICNKYKSSFMDTVRDYQYGGGYETFRTQIYKAVEYRKPNENKQKRKKKDVAANYSDDEDECKEEILKKRKKNTNMVASNTFLRY